MHKNLCSKDLPSYQPRDVLAKAKAAIWWRRQHFTRWMVWLRGISSKLPLQWATCQFILSLRGGVFPRWFWIHGWLQVTEEKNDRFLDRKKGKKNFFNSTKEIWSPSTSFMNLQSNFPATLPFCLSHPGDWVPGSGWVPSFAREVQGLPKDLVRS